MKQVKDLMTKKVVTVRDDAGIKDVCRMLMKFKMSGFPVVNKTGKLMGFISERDVIAAVSKPKFLDRTAANIMSRKIRTIKDDEPVTNASKIFAQENYRQLPVVHNGRLVGIISRKDIVNQMMGHYY